MSHHIEILLSDELRRYVDTRTSGNDVYDSPSEYIRDLIRHDMQEYTTAMKVMSGLNDIKEGRFSARSILDIKDET